MGGKATNIPLTWERNCILNEKTLSLVSTRGTFINSKKNCHQILHRILIQRLTSKTKDFSIFITKRRL